MTSPRTDPWLVVVDLQHAFTDPASSWYADGSAAAATVVARLLEEFAGRVVMTRFVRDPGEQGAWRDYYDAWPQFRVPPEDPVWDLSLAVPPGAPVVDEPTFGKWGAALAAVVGEADLVVCGVATECCVLATAVAAADAGRRVTVVADACAGGTAEGHRAALDLLGANAPLITVVRSSELVRS
ncbi:isochorismatase family protein [Nocardioides korecus]